MGRHLENMDFGPRRDPGVRIIPPNSDQYPIPNTHQLGGGEKRFDRSQAREGVHGQAMEVQEGLTNFYSMFAEFLKKSDRVHAFPEVATPQ